MARSFEEFVAGLRINPAYKGIDLDRELAKMDAWLSLPQNRQRQKTPRFVMNWLNKCEESYRSNPSENLPTFPSWFSEPVKRLTGYYNRELNAYQLKEWYALLKNLKPEQLNSSISRCIKTLPVSKGLPTPQTILENVELYQPRMLEVKKQFKPASKEMVRDSMALLEKRLSNQIDSLEFSDEMHFLERKYPGVGFKQEAEKIFKMALEKKSKESKDLSNG